MKSAQSFIETALLFAFVVIISLALMGIFTNNSAITKLTNKSKITVNTDISK